jgi:hypothetical protein
MTTPGCHGPTCIYTGPSSRAVEGTYTGTASYLANAEIAYANTTSSGALYIMDEDSYSDILVFDNT